MEESSSSHMDWLIRYRWIMSLSGVALTLTADCLLPGVLPLRALLANIAGLALWNAVLFLYVRWLCSVRGLARWRNPLIQVQLGLDPLFLTLFLHFFGGLETPFFFFYLIYVLIASVLLSRRASLASAGLVSLLYTALLILEWRRVIPHHNLAGYRVSTRFQEPIHIFTTSLTLTSTAFLTAHFASGMVSTLRARGEELMEARLDCERRAQQLSEANVNLEELDEMRSGFVRLAGHELKAPAAAIQSYLRLILEGTVPPERTKDILHRAEQRARGQLALIGDLLDLARLEEPRTQVKVEWMDQGEVLCGVIELMRSQAEAAGVLLRADIPTDTLVMSANLDHMHYLWTNLIGNAIKYTPRGGSVTASLVNGTEEIVGVVQDTGIGISPDDLPHIFDEFYRAENAKALESHGTGLGLSIAERVVKTYGGRIWAESTLGEGSTFTFALPKGSSQGLAIYSAVVTSGPTPAAD